MHKVIVLGGSGFIGTNIITYLLQQGNYEILNLDANAPRNREHLAYWKKIDILNKKDLEENIFRFDPDYVIHMAARTDLDEKKSISGYNANIDGVRNLIDILNRCKNVKRVIFTSSMLVCSVGYSPSSYEDYCPPNLYGESKVLTERIIKEAGIESFEWCIIRPTSIWGPWFGAPYRDFFDMVQQRKYFKIDGKVAVKTFGFVGNAVFQIHQLLLEKQDKVNKKTFYIGDHPPTNINEWADEIAEALNIRLLKIPFFVFKTAAWVGDFLSLFKIPFKMSSFRLKNMMTNNIIEQLEDTYKVIPQLPYSRKDGVKITVDWMKQSAQNHSSN